MDYKEDFPLLQNRDIAYLDSASTTQKPQVVIDSLKYYYEHDNANVHRGAYTLSVETSEKYEGVREKVAKFIHAKHPEEIIFSKNATESLNLIANSWGLTNLKKEDSIVLSIMEHHSNLVPWQRVSKVTGAKLEYLYLNDDFQISEEEIKNKITDHTKVVGITHVSNALGTVNDVEKIIAYAHKKGAIVIVDASQSIPHREIDVQKMNADFLVFSGHKMMAPLGIGVLYGKKELLTKMSPFLMGGDMIEYVYEQDTTFAGLPNKFEAGTQNVEGVIGLGTAIDYLQSIGYENIQAVEQELLTYGREKLASLPYVETYYPKDVTKHSSVISFNIKGVHPHDVASILDSVGVCVRSGNHCTQPLMRYLGIDSTCRASLYFYNTKEDIDRLIHGIQKAYGVFEKYIK